MMLSPDVGAPFRDSTFVCTPLPSSTHTTTKPPAPELTCGLNSTRGKCAFADAALDHERARQQGALRVGKEPVDVPEAAAAGRAVASPHDEISVVVWIVGGIIAANGRLELPDGTKRPDGKRTELGRGWCSTRDKCNEQSEEGADRQTSEPVHKFSKLPVTDTGSTLSWAEGLSARYRQRFTRSAVEF